MIYKLNSQVRWAFLKFKETLCPTWTENGKVTKRKNAKYYYQSLITILAKELRLSSLDRATEIPWINKNYLHILHTKLC